MVNGSKMTKICAVLFATFLFYDAPLVLSGCSRPLTKETLMDNIKFTVQFHQTPDSLVLHYAVENLGDKDAYLLNQLYRSDPELKIDPNLIYVELQPKTKSICLSKKIADLPTDRYVTAPVCPFVTPVRAGKTFSEDVVLKLPLKEYKEYGMKPAEREWEERTYEQIHFVLGFYWAVEGLQEESRKIDGAQVILTKAPAGRTLQFGQLVSPPVYLHVPVFEAK